MNQLDDLADRLTIRLRVDPELRMEVAHELRAHLEDSAAEFRLAGASDEDATVSATKAMGDEAEVAEQLWQANRRRVRIRKAVKWAAGVTLMPAAIAVSATVAWGAIVSLVMLFAGIASIGWGDSSAGILHRIVKHLREAQVNRIPPSQQALFNMQGYRDARIGPDKSLMEQYPNDPVYCAEFANATVLRRPAEGSQMSAVDIDRITDVLDHGKLVEPNNAFYPLLKAGVLFSASVREIHNKPYQATFEYIDGKGDKKSFDILRHEVLNRAMMDRALAELHEAAAKPYLDSYAGDLLDRRLALLPPATKVSDQMLRLQTQYWVGLPYLNVYFQVSSAAAFASAQAVAEHHPEQATAIVGDLRRLARLAAARSRFGVDLTVAQGMYCRALSVAAWIDLQTNNQAQFPRIRKSFGNTSGSFLTFEISLREPGPWDRTCFFMAGLLRPP